MNGTEEYKTLTDHDCHPDAVECCDGCLMLNGFDVSRFYRGDFTDFNWYELMKSCGESLPEEYCDVFDRQGEYAEEYHDIMTCNIYTLKL